MTCSSCRFAERRTRKPKGSPLMCSCYFIDVPGDMMACRNFERPVPKGCLVVSMEGLE